VKIVIPYLLELLDGTSVDTTALVDQVTCRGDQQIVIVDGISMDEACLDGGDAYRWWWTCRNRRGR
jgi:hypothetical protein